MTHFHTASMYAATGVVVNENVMASLQRALAVELAIYMGCYESQVERELTSKKRVCTTVELAIHVHVYTCMYGLLSMRTLAH